MREQIAEECG